MRVGHLGLANLREVFIALVLLASWLEPLELHGPEYEVLDFFAGAARMARASRFLGYPSAAFDISYNAKREVFDMNSAAGFTSPGWFKFSLKVQAFLCKREWRR